jgi:serine carboxypeptidase 1
MDRFFSLLVLLSLLVGIGLGSLRSGSAATTTTGTPDGSELWGYVEVRPSK